ncbi:FAS1-like dehydratase domain-containing protein [Caballeronia glebae]|nr:MaoC family dehydratase N-terminal domain-containing protein [Caballeronia glebae]
MEFDTLYAGWTSRTEILHEHVDARRVDALAATLDVSMDLAIGCALPAGWQWLFFNPVARRGELGKDGHPRRDTQSSFLPPVPLPRRMWAGSRMQYLQEVPIGSDVTRRSRITKLVKKEGRAGKLCFVTVEHRTGVKGADCIVEEQDIVYREASSASSRAETAPDAPVEFRQAVTADSTLLFRYSALTFNGHRIHYDKPYACEVEGYRNLVVHGPLTATLLQNFATSCRPNSRLSQFEFKGLSPLFVDEAFELQAWADADDSSLLQMRVIDTRGSLGMQASAHFESR